MSNDVIQNPRNKVGRHSGAGASGISEVQPTDAEARRGMQPVRIGGSTRQFAPLGAAFGAVALISAGVAAYAVWRARQSRSVGTRILHRLGMK